MVKEKDRLLESAGESIEYVRQYINFQKKYIKLEIAEKTSLLISSMVSTLIVGVFAFTGYIFLLIALAVWLGVLLNNPALGYLLTGISQFLLLGALIVWQKPLLTNPILTSVLSQFFTDETNQ